MMDVHNECNSLLPLEAQEDDEKWFDDIDADMLVLKQKIHNWIREAEHDMDAELKEKASVKSKRSSKSSSKSSSSRLSSTRPSRSERALMEKLKMAELKAEVEFMEKSQSAEFQGHKLKIEEQYAKSQARMRILEDLQNPEVINAETNPYIYHNEDSKLQLPGEYDNKFTLGMGASHFTENQAKEYEGIPRDRSSGATFMKKNYEKEPDLVGTTSDMLCRLLQLQSALDVDIETFDGNVINYHYFIALFREVVESKVDDPRGKLTRLIKYTSGDARELIRHCIQLPSNEGFKHAKYLLEKVYGNPHKILASYRKEVKNW